MPVDTTASSCCFPVVAIPVAAAHVYASRQSQRIATPLLRVVPISSFSPCTLNISHSIEQLPCRRISSSPCFIVFGAGRRLPCHPKIASFK